MITPNISIHSGLKGAPKVTVTIDTYRNDDCIITHYNFGPL